MKNALCSLFVLLAIAGQAIANDGGMAVIDVDTIKAKNVITEGKKTGSEIKITGKGARKLMAILPNESTVIPGYDGHGKSLAISAKDKKTDVIISCSDVKVIDTPSGLSLKPVTPTCVIALDTTYENEFGDAWSFDPAEEVCKK